MTTRLYQRSPDAPARALLTARNPSTATAAGPGTSPRPHLGLAASRSQSDFAGLKPRLAQRRSNARDPASPVLSFDARRNSLAHQIDLICMLQLMSARGRRATSA
jgi:hypothetical protein